MEGLFWLVTEKCEFGGRRGDGAFSLAQTFTPGEMEQMIYLNLLQEVSLGFALAGYPIEDEEKLKMKKKSGVLICRTTVVESVPRAVATG